MITMALIERNELCKILFEEVKNLDPNSLGDLFIQRGLTLALIHIRMQPEVKQEQEHGHWEYDETIGGMKYYRCTNCEKIEPGSECIIDENQTSWFNFCPKCGAKMKMNKTQNCHNCQNASWDSDGCTCKRTGLLVPIPSKECEEYNK